MTEITPKLQFIVSAPGILILHGEYTTSYGFTGLATSLDLRTKLLFETEKENLDETKIELHMRGLNLHHFYNVREVRNALLSKPIQLVKGYHHSSFNLENPEYIDISKLLDNAQSFVHKLTGSMPLSPLQECELLSFFCLLSGMFSCVPLRLGKFSIVLTSELPHGTDLGKKVSYSVCLAASLIHYIRSRIAAIPSEQKDMSRKGFKSLKYWCCDLNNFDTREKDMISRWAFLSERATQSNPTIVDSVVSTYGSILLFKREKTDHTPYIKLIPDPRVLRVLIVYTGEAMDESKVLAALSSLKERHTTVIEPILHSIDGLSVSAAHILKKLSSMGGEAPPAASHSIESIETEASVDYEIAKLGELIDINQDLLHALDISNPVADSVIHIMRKHGFHGKLSGTGSGEYAYMIIPPVAQHSAIISIKNSLHRKSMHFLEVQLAGSGVIVKNNPSAAEMTQTK